MPDKQNDALRSLSSELAGLKTAGQGFVPTPIVVDCGEMTESESPVAPQTPAPNPNESKILRFIKLCKVTDGLTVREIAGGTQLPIADVRKALDSLVASGTLTVTGDSENLGNHLRYNLPTSEQEPIHADEVADQRINSLAEVERQRDRLAHPAPQPPPNYRPTDAEVAAALLAQEAARKAIKFTAEEREQLKLMEGRLVGLNPNIALKR